MERQASFASIVKGRIAARPFGRRALELVRALEANNASSTAAAMAFNFFLSLIPLLVLAGAVLGLLVRKRGVDPLMAPFLDAIPKEAAQLVRRELEGLGGSVAAPLAPIGVVGFLFVASGGTHHMMDVFEVAVGAKRRAWWKQRAIAVAWLSAMVGALSLVVTGLVTLNGMVHPVMLESTAHAATPPMPPAGDREARHGAPPPAHAPPASVHSAHNAPPLAPHALPSADAPHDPPALDPSATDAPLPRKKHASRWTMWETALAVVLVLGVILTGLAALYRFGVEHPPGIERRAWPGAGLAVLTWFIVSWAFGAYAKSLGTYAAFYGSIAAVAITLIWLFLTSLALLAGAELNALLERESQAPTLHAR